MKYIIPSFSERFPIYESVDQAKNYLLKRYAIQNEIKTSDIDEEIKKKILNDPKFLEVKELTSKNPGYTPMFTKFRFDQKASMENLREIISKLEEYKQTLKSDLPMPVTDYEKVIPDEEDQRPGWERLNDDLTSIKWKRKLKKLYNEFTPGLKRMFARATPEQIEELSQSAVNLENIKKEKEDMNPSTEKLEKTTAWKSFSWGIKKYEDTVTYPQFKDPQVAIDKMIKDIQTHIENWNKEEVEVREGEDSEILKKIKALGAGAGILYAKKGYIVASVRSPKSQEIFCDSIVYNRMCIRSESNFWSYGQGRVQFMLVNENLPDPDKYHLIGFTVDPEQKITAAYDRHNHTFYLPDGSKPKTLSELLNGMDYPKDLIETVLSKFEKETHIKVSMERFNRDAANLTKDRIIDSLFDLSKGLLKGLMDESEWQEIAGTVSKLIFEDRNMKKSDFLEVFRENGILNQSALNVFDALIGKDATSSDIKQIISSTEEMLDTLPFALELYKEKTEKRGYDPNVEASITKSLESGPKMLDKLKQRLN